MKQNKPICLIRPGRRRNLPISGYFQRASHRFLGDIIDRRTTRVLARWGSAVTTMLLAASGLVAIAPSASAALSGGCQSVNSIGSADNLYDKYWQEVNNPLFTFSSGETLKVTFSNPRGATTAHIMAGTSAAPRVPASYTSKTSTTTFPATLTYTLDQNYTYIGFETTAGAGVGFGSGENVDMVFECGITQTITFANPGDQELPTGTVNLTATSDSGLAVTLTSTTLPVCTVAGTTLTLVDEGTCTVVASQAGAGDYLAAADVTRSLTVSKATQTITFANPGSKALSLGTFNVTPSADSGLTVTMASTTVPVCSVTGFTVRLITAGTCTLAASQAGNANYDAAPGISRSFSVTAAAPVPDPVPDPVPALAVTDTTATVLTWSPDTDRDKYVSSGSGVEISAEALAPTGGKRAVDDGDAFALVDGDDIELDIKGVADDSTLTVSFTFADPDRPECAIESQGEVKSGTTPPSPQFPSTRRPMLRRVDDDPAGRNSHQAASNSPRPSNSDHERLSPERSMRKVRISSGLYRFHSRSNANSRN